MADNINIVDYVDSLVRWITNDIQIPQDSKVLLERIIVLSRNCENSLDNISLLLSVHGFDRLLGALARDFNAEGIRNWNGINERRETLKLCREIVKLVEILGFGPNRPYLISYTLCGIMRVVYFEGMDRRNKGRIVRILHSLLYNSRMPLFRAYDDFIIHHMGDPLSPISELSLCADITSQFLERDYYSPTSTSFPLSNTLRTIVSRIYEVCQYEGFDNDWINEEFVELSAFLEKIMKLLCRVSVKFGSRSVLHLGSNECVMIPQITKILKHALLHRRPGARSFNGRHLLYALLMAKYIYEGPQENYIVAGPEDVKVVLDFAMSDLPNRYLFNGRRRLRDLVDQMVPGVLNSFHADYVLNNWNRVTGLR